MRTHDSAYERHIRHRKRNKGFREPRAIRAGPAKANRAACAPQVLALEIKPVVFPVLRMRSINGLKIQRSTYRLMEPIHEEFFGERGVVRGVVGVETEVLVDFGFEE